MDEIQQVYLSFGRCKTPRKILNLLLTVLKAPKHTALQAGGRGFESLIAHHSKT